MMAVMSMESLPLGFRFRPTDEELINHYLRLKINGRDSEVQVIPEIDVCKWEPWDLPGLSMIKTDDPEWFFFCPRDRKYPNGNRSNRATDAGYWKATGKDRTIKSRKSGSNTTVIGMKKTVVFYRGRAPKGERTNWIMHEYRATQKQLDGTHPGQAAFILCRLFRKPEEKVDIVKYDEVEHTGSSPTTTKSSPDDISSDVVQETPMSDMQVGNQSEVIKRWLTDKSEDITPNVLLPVDTSSISYNSYMASDVEDDHVPEGTGMEVHHQLEDNSKFYEPASFQIDYKDLSQLQSKIHTELAPYTMGSPFASDFGYDNNSFPFLDGSSEQEISLTELLDEVFNNQDEYCDESTSQKNSVVGSDTQLSGQECMVEAVPPGNSYVKESGAYSDTDTDMAHLQCNFEMGASGWSNKHLDDWQLLQMQTSFASFQDFVPRVNQDLSGWNMGDLGDNSVGRDASPANSAMGSTYGLNLEEPTEEKNLVHYSSGPVGGTGIKIRSRQPQQQPNSDKFGTQGTAPRRIRLQMKSSPGLVCHSEARGASLGEKEDEVQSTVTEDKASEHRPTSAEQEEESELWKTRGIAPRRIRLQMKSSPGLVCHSEVRGTSRSEEEDEVQSTVTEAKEASKRSPTFAETEEESEAASEHSPTFAETEEESEAASEHSSTFVEPEEESTLLTFEESKGTSGESSTKLRLGVKHGGPQGSSQMEMSDFVNVPPPHRAPRSLLICTVGVSLVFVLCAVFIGAWK